MYSNTANKSLISNLAQTTMTLSDFLDDILFVIVLYKQTPEKSCAYNALQDLSRTNNHSLSLFIYDNSPEASAIHSSTVMYRHDAQNSGVSKAYNEAAVYADKLKKKWLLLLDQDTLPEQNFHLIFFEALKQWPESLAFVPQLSDRKGLISPFRWSLGKGGRIKPRHGILQLRNFRFVNSGLLIDLQAFRKVQGYDEKIPLDFSDIAFGEKLKSIADHFVVTKSTWQHSFSGSIKNQREEACLRFGFFCLGSFRFGQVFGHSNFLFARTLIRAIKLSLRYMSIDFIKTFFKHA